MGTGDANRRGNKKCRTPSLRRNYPVQVQRVISQPSQKISDQAPRGQGKGIYLFYIYDCNFLVRSTFKTLSNEDPYEIYVKNIKEYKYTSH